MVVDAIAEFMANIENGIQPAGRQPEFHSNLPPNRNWPNVPRAALRSALGYLLAPRWGGRIDG